MSTAIQLFAYLLLTLLGLVAPVISILLSIFGEGLSKLTTQYENEKSQHEDNLRDQLKKIADEKLPPNVNKIKQSIRNLERMKKVAEKKLFFINPRKQTLRLVASLLFSFACAIIALMSTSSHDILGYLLVSLILCGYALYVVWGLLNVIIEVNRIINNDRNNYRVKIIELLSSLVQGNRGAQLFIQKVYIKFNDKNITDSMTEIAMTPNIKISFPVGINNLEKRMAKMVEIGFIFPLDFVIEKKASYGITTDKTQQIVRYNVDHIQGDTLYLLPHLSVTPLKEGAHKITAFIKAENIEAVDRIIMIKVK